MENFIKKRIFHRIFWEYFVEYSAEYSGEYSVGSQWKGATWLARRPPRGPKVELEMRFKIFIWSRPDSNHGQAGKNRAILPLDHSSVLFTLAAKSFKTVWKVWVGPEREPAPKGQPPSHETTGGNHVVPNLARSASWRLQLCLRVMYYGMFIITHLY